MTGTVAIYSPHDDIRLLLRSLLRLHHYEVSAEGATPRELRVVTPLPGLTVVLDADLDEVGWTDAVFSVRKAHPDLKFLLVTDSRSAQTDSRARAIGISTVLRRPFAMRQLVEAMRAAAGTTDPPGGPSAPPASGSA